MSLNPKCGRGRSFLIPKLGYSLQDFKKAGLCLYIYTFKKPLKNNMCYMSIYVESKNIFLKHFYDVLFSLF